MQQLKFHSLLFFLIFFFGKGSFAQGRVLNYELSNSYSVQEIENMLNTFNIPTVFIAPRFEVNVYKVTYETTNASNTGLTTATGMLAIPKNVTCPMPLVSYQHGTTSLREDVPSYGNTESKLGIILTSAVGYITSLPDYLGLGDSPGFHPYIHAQSQATATVDLLRAVRHLSDSLNYNLNNQLFLIGYSQGGHATMATHKYIQDNLANEFIVTASVPMSGPYDVSGAQSSELFNTGTYATPGYLPYIIMGYQEAYGNIYQDLSDIFVSPYDTMIVRLFDGYHSLSASNRVLPRNVTQMLQPAFYNDFVNNPNNTMRLALADNDIYNWTPTAPTYLLYCNGDEQVYAQNSIIAYNTMLANGAEDIRKKDWGNYTHTGCLMYALIDAYSFLNNYKNTHDNLQITLNSTNAMNGNNGSITATVTGGDGLYSYNWVGQQNNTNSINNLSRGSYLLQVSDSRGCYTHASRYIDNILAIENISNSKFSIFPNPAKDFIIIKNNAILDTDYSIKIVNALGQIITTEHNIFNNEITLNTTHLANGLYLFEIKYGSETEIFKILIED